ncbi:MAG: polysaccharide biosynthesis protein [Alicyclobacillaceae bacterium]|nr:polysaccharide biosynthesis protein [Alicyclobacillaceae bacterium]
MGVDRTRRVNQARRDLTRGASVMVASVTLAKLLGIVWVVPLTVLIGNVGLGIYQNAYALYTILLTVATSGFPTAMGKLVSERLALGRTAEVEQLFRVAMRVVTVLAIVCSALVWFGAPVYSRLVALRDEGQAVQALVWAVRALAPAVVVVPLMSGLRGYLQGFQWLEPSGYSQAVEQLFRIAAMLVGAWVAMRATGDPARGAAAATFGAFVGALAGLVLLAAATIRLRRTWRRQVRYRQPGRRWANSPAQPTNHEAFLLLWRYALPVCLGALVVPISNLVDSLTVQNFLMFAGESFRTATEQYGILTRQAYTLIQLPLSFAMAIGASVLPAISGAAAVRDQRAVERTVTGTLRSMFFITFPMSAAFLILAKPIDVLLFGSTQGAAIISSVSFMGIFSGLELVSTYMLQGFGRMYRPVRNMLLGVALKLVLNVALILPLHILGAALATTAGYLLSSTLNLLAVRKYGRVPFSAIRLSARSLVAAVILCPVLGAADLAVSRATGSLAASHPRLWAALDTLIPLAAGAVVYLAASIRLQAVTADELQRLPGVGRQLARLARRIRP